MTSPTQRTLDLLRRNNAHPWVVEYWNAHSRRRVDLFGIFDILALHGPDTLALQACAACDVAKRQKKLTDSEWTPRALEAGWRVQVIGWRRPTKTLRQWRSLVRELSPAGWITIDSPTAERSRDPAPGAAPAPGPGGARPPYKCKCGATFPYELGAYGCPNCHAMSGPAWTLWVVPT